MAPREVVGILGRGFLKLWRLAVGCGRDDEAALRFSLAATGVETLIVGARAGAVTVSTKDGATSVEVQVGVPGRKVDRARDLSIARTAGGSRLSISTVGEEEFRVAVTAPPGLDLKVSVRKGTIRADGAWGSAFLKADKGDVRLIATAAPSSDLKCETGAGNVDIVVASTFRGPVSLSSMPDKVDVERDERVTFGWLYNPARTNVRGFIGPRMTKEERIAREWPKTGIWGTARKGSVRFRVK